MDPYQFKKEWEPKTSFSNKMIVLIIGAIVIAIAEMVYTYFFKK